MVNSINSIHLLAAMANVDNNGKIQSNKAGLSKAVNMLLEMKLINKNKAKTPEATMRSLICYSEAGKICFNNTNGTAILDKAFIKENGGIATIKSKALMILKNKANNDSYVQAKIEKLENQLAAYKKREAIIRENNKLKAKLASNEIELNQINNIIE
jgi:hypothetical protein